MTSEMEEAIRRMVAEEVDQRLTYVLVCLTIMAAVYYWFR
jgi:hypothetical protein